MVQVVDGIETTIAKINKGFTNSHWYKMKVRVGMDYAVGFIDDVPIIKIKSTFNSGGRVGLYARGINTVEFDDFKIQTVALKNYLLTEKKIITEKLIKKLKKDSNFPYVFIFNKKINNYRLTAQINSNDNAKTHNLIFIPAFKDSINHYEFEITKNKSTLYKISEGEKSSQLFTTTDKLDNIRFKFKSGVLSISDKTKLLFSTYTGYLDSQGAIKEISSGYTIKKLSFNEINPPLPVASINQVFADETLMKSWSNHNQDWKKSTTANEYTSTYWHTAYFFGDVEIEALLTKNNKNITLNNPTILALSLAKPLNDIQKGNGYTAKYFYDKKKNINRIILIRENKIVKTLDLKATIPHRIKFSKIDSTLLCYINNKLRLIYEDKNPIKGKRVAWAIKGFKLSPKNVQVYNNNLKTYSFNNAPVDWMIGSGVWEVTNRWECDPRWSFWGGMPVKLAKRRISALEKYFSKRSSWKIKNLKSQVNNIIDKSNKYISLWHKQQFKGDLLVEFYVGQMMDRMKGNYKNYIRDFNITICSDGENLLQGYTCILGGWLDKKSVILRNGEIVAEKTGPVLYRGFVHRRWIKIRVTKNNNIIRFNASYLGKRNKIYELIDLYYKDKSPLSGTKIALWSYDCGILISKFRVSSESIAISSDPLKIPSFIMPKLYDDKKNK